MKTSFIHKARREQEGEADLEQKQRISTILNHHFGFACIFHDLTLGIHKIEKWHTRELTQEQMESGDFYLHKPDMIVTNSSPIIIVEIDGDVHWQSSRAVKRTNLRNEHYESSRLRFLWLTTQEVDNTDELLLKIITEKLSRYSIRPKEFTK